MPSMVFLDDDANDEDVDGIQKLLQSSLSPRHSPMPFHQQLRQSIRSSMLKEVSTLTLTTQANTRSLLLTSCGRLVMKKAISGCVRMLVDDRSVSSCQQTC